MKKVEKREVEVEYCDFCKDEVSHLRRCSICGREMCCKDGGKTHSAFSLEIYRYKDGEKDESSNICKECSAKKFGGTLEELFDGMLKKESVQMIEA
ncbi:MAG: hypothetical protein KAR54_02615 [Candidatus Pacebacteria bacterium]|nr:hypothetical protein [Candidatus Paceibacterota bacterium]